MNRLYNYVIKSLSATFFPIFFTLFSITSVIYLVKIASLTSVITIDFYELLFLYFLNIPVILFYTLPVTYFISASLSIANLSSEYELIVITSFGLSPLKILKILIPISLLFTIAIFIISFILIPKTSYIQNKFINKKKQEAKFNIKPSEYGQKFGPWYMYVESKTKDIYNNMILYKNEANKDTFVVANSANIINNKNSLTLNLINGSSSIITNSLKYIEFSNMTLNSSLKEEKKISTLKDLINYWIKDNSSYKKRVFIRNILISLLPLISLLFYISFGYFNPRHEKNKASIYSLVFVVIYLTIMQKISVLRDINYVYIFIAIWIISSFISYQIKVKKYF